MKRMPVARRLGTLAFVLTLLATPAMAQHIYAVRPVPGFACAKLNLTEQQALDMHFAVPIRTVPEPSATVGTTASAVLFVRQPIHVVNGYIEVLQLTGQPGWIERKWVKPYDPLARCVPSVMSNGRVGSG